MLYLCRLGHGFIKGCCSTFDPFLNGFVTPLSIGVALRYCRSLLHAELSQLRSDLQQLVNVRLVLCDGLPEQLQSELKGRENIKPSLIKYLLASNRSSIRNKCFISFHTLIWSCCTRRASVSMAGGGSWLMRVSVSPSHGSSSS